MGEINLTHAEETASLEEENDVFFRGEKSFNEKLLENLNHRFIHNVSACMATDMESSITRHVNPNSEIVQISCKGLIGGNFALVSGEIQNPLEINDLVIVQTNEGVTEIATIEEIGELAKLKGEELGALTDELPKVLRKLNDEDITRLEQNMEDEVEAVTVFHDKIKIHNLEMKLVDVHYQFDRKKLYFYYTADGRVDFRQLAKDLASVFRTRIELRQIGVRDEAKKVGGIGMCGREFCCKAFMTSFKKISTSLANAQNLNTSLSKLSGPCGKLKCCLSFEADVENQVS